MKDKIERFIAEAGPRGVHSTDLYLKFGLRKDELEPLVTTMDTIERFKAPSTGGRPPVIYRYVGASPFDQIKSQDEDGERWYGRDMMPHMDYSQWRDFETVIEKAKASLALVQGSDQAEHHFAQVRKVIESGRWGTQRVEDYRLTRFGAYLTAMAGDDTKEAVAHARVYFAVKAREAELAQPAPTTSLSRLEMAKHWYEAEEQAAIGSARVKELETEVEELVPRTVSARAAEEHNDGQAVWDLKAALAPHLKCKQTQVLIVLSCMGVLKSQSKGWGRGYKYTAQPAWQDLLFNAQNTYVDDYGVEHTNEDGTVRVKAGMQVEFVERVKAAHKRRQAFRVA